MLIFLIKKKVLFFLLYNLNDFKKILMKKQQH